MTNKEPAINPYYNTVVVRVILIGGYSLYFDADLLKHGFVQVAPGLVKHNNGLANLDDYVFIHECGNYSICTDSVVAMTVQNLINKGR